MYDIGVVVGVGLVLVGLTVAVLQSETVRAMVRRFLLGPPNLRLDELGEILPLDEEVSVDFDTLRKIPGATVNVQIRRGNVSVIYNGGKVRDALIETVDISARPKAGIIFTMKDGKMVVLQRVGGRTIENPDLTVAEDREVRRFMKRVRDIAAKQKK